MHNKNLRKKFLLILFFMIFIIGALCYHEVYVSYNNLIVNSYDINTGNKCKARFVVIADLHDNVFGDNNKKLISTIKSQNPNFIVIDGDMLNNNSRDCKSVVSLIKELNNISNVYYALGNHEFEYIKNNHNNFIDQITNAGAIILENEYQDIVVNNTNIRIGGMFSYAFGAGNKVDKETMDKDVYNFLEDFQDTTNYKVMLSHRPDSFIFGDASEVWNIDLIISAHNHGGQVVLPFLGGLYGGDQGYFPKYIHGIYQKGNMKIAITSGLGSHKQKLPRFNNCPEIMVINLY